mmetsp:Transcript_20917/g.57561  ORF Transcript_20917/g.57561 Transcript_20917/m.57561 type:complete len:105 (+) Transcript_20917:191-505(+)
MAIFRAMASLSLSGGLDWKIVNCVVISKIIMFGIGALVGAYIARASSGTFTGPRAASVSARARAGIFGVCLACTNDLGVALPVLGTLFPSQASPLCFLMVGIYL